MFARAPLHPSQSLGSGLPKGLLHVYCCLLVGVFDDITGFSGGDAEAAVAAILGFFTRMVGLSSLC